MVLASSQFLTPSQAGAAACCIGSTSGSAERLGPCEWLGLGLSYSLHTAPASWTSTGELRANTRSHSLDQRWTTSFVLRPNRYFELGAALPLVLQVRSIDEQTELGVGPGDLRLTFTLDPFGGQPSVTLKGPPLPDFGLTVQLPTGIPLEHSTGSLGAGATGTGWAAVGPNLRLSRTGLNGSLQLSLGIELPLPRPDVDEGTLPGSAWSGGFSGAWFVNSKATLSLGGGVRGVTRGRLKGELLGDLSVEPFLAASGTFAVKGGTRLSIGIRPSIPVPFLGRNGDAQVILTMGIRRVWKGKMPALKHQVDQ